MDNKSRALKRLGVAGVSACTLIATPYLGFTAPASANHVTGVQLFSPFVDATGVATISSRPDGTDSLVRLLADAPVAASTVEFFYQIGALPRVSIAADGARPFLADFNTASLAGPVTLIVEARDNTGAVLPVGGTDTAPVTIDNNAPTVNVTSPAATTTAAGTIGRYKANNTVAVSGTTSTGYYVPPVAPSTVSASTVRVADILGSATGPAVRPGGQTVPVQADGTYSAIVAVTDAEVASPASPALPTRVAYINAKTVGGVETDETELASIYDQAVTTVTVTPNPILSTPTTDPAAAPAPTQFVESTATVLDQNGKPVGGAFVELDVNQDGDSLDANLGESRVLTNALGAATVQVPRTAAGTRNIDFFANQDLTRGFDSAAGDKRTTVAQNTAAPVATTATFSAVDPSTVNTTNTPAFSAGETSFSTTEALPTARLTLRDQNNQPLPDGTAVFYSVTFNPDEDGTDVPADTVRRPLAPANSAATTTSDAAGTTNRAQSYVDIPTNNITGVDGAEGTYTITAFVNRDNDLAQSAGDLVATTTLTFDTAKLSFDSGNIGQAEAGAAAGTTRGLTYTLENGTPLDGRALSIALNSTATPTSSRAVFGTQPAGTTKVSDTSATVVTDAAGKAAVVVNDPATLVDEDGSAVTPDVQQQENVTLTASALRPRGALVVGQNTTSTVVRFIRGAGAAELRVDNVAGVFGGTVATPGRPVNVVLSVDSFLDGTAPDTGTDLSGLPVTLTTDKGYFTQALDATQANSGVDSPEELQPATAPTAAGSPVGAYQPVAGAYTLTSSDNGGAANSTGGLATGQVRFTIAIDRDVDFDDDGKATANVQATVAGITRTIQVVFTTDYNGTTAVQGTPGAATVTYTGAPALNPSATDPIQIVPVPADQDLTDRSANADDPAFQVRRKDGFGNLVEDLTTVSVDVGTVSTSAVESSYLGDEDETFTVDSGLAAFQLTGSETTRTQVVTASDSSVANTSYGDSDNVATGFQFSRTNIVPFVTTNSTISDTQTVSYYSPLISAFTYAFATTPGSTLGVNQAANTVVTVKDARGNPVQGLGARFFRSGPFAGSADQTGQGFEVTNDDGQAGFTFTSAVAGRATVNVIIENNGIEIGRGQQNVDFVAGAQATALTLSATRQVRFPAGPVLTGVLRNGNGAPLAGRTVTIVYKQQAVAGLAAFRPVLNLRTDANGVYRGTIKPTVNAVFQAIYLGNNADTASASGYSVTKVQLANPVVTNFPQQPRAVTVRANTRVPVRGTVFPAALRNPVVLQWIQPSGRIANLSTFVTPNAQGQYVITRAFPVKGTYRLRVLGVTTKNNVASASRTIILRVV